MIRIMPMVLWASFTACSPSSSSPALPNKTAADDAAVARCGGVRTPVQQRSGSLAPDSVCRVAELAFRRVTSADAATDGVSPADTSLVTAIVVDSLAEIEADGRTRASWRVVTFRLRERPYQAEVRIDNCTGAVSLRPVHR